MVVDKYDISYTGYEGIVINICNSDPANLHTHDFLEIGYIGSGSVNHSFCEKNTVLKKGDYFIIDYGDSHSYKSCGEEPASVINCLFVAGFIDSTMKNCKSFKDVVSNYNIRFNYQRLADIPTQYIFHDDNGSIMTMLLEMQKELKEKKHGYVEVVRSLLINILIMTMRKIERPDYRGEYSDAINYIINYANKNHKEKINFGNIAKQLNYSNTYLSAKFKDETGINFCNYVQRLRIETACKLLVNTEKKISEVAELSGYENVKFFNVLFKKVMTMPPREYRRIFNNIHIEGAIPKNHFI